MPLESSTSSFVREACFNPLVYDQSVKAAVRANKASEDWTEYDGPAQAIANIIDLLAAEAEDANSHRAVVTAITVPGIGPTVVANWHGMHGAQALACCDRAPV